MSLDPCRAMILRVGLPASTGSLPIAAEALDQPCLISANSLWCPKRREFRTPGLAINDLDVALDSAGFVAMVRYGGYRWTPEQYVELAGSYSWAWWASMDFCCEPQVAGNRAVVAERIERTALYLFACRCIAYRWRTAGAFWLADPMPVLQGWTPDDYESSIEQTDAALGGEWPALVGVGSVCRRSWGGAEGLGMVLRRIFDRLPAGVGVHLFGVKGDALARLEGNPRVVSSDSMAWDYAARMAEGSTTMAKRIDAMAEWVGAQGVESKQQPLFGA